MMNLSSTVSVPQRRSSRCREHETFSDHDMRMLLERAAELRRLIKKLEADRDRLLPHHQLVRTEGLAVEEDAPDYPAEDSSRTVMGRRGAIEEDLVERAGAAGIKLLQVSAPVMKSLSEKENPQGMLAILRQKHLGLDALPSGQGIVGLVSPQDPGNVGTVLRTLDAVGGEGLFLLDGGVELYHPSVVRASMGMLFWLPVVQASFTGFAAWAKANGIELVGTSAHAGMDYRQVLPENGRTILVFGSEQKGLTPEQLAACDVRVSMPMRGRASSLNLAVAAGILLYRWADNESRTNKRIINEV